MNPGSGKHLPIALRRGCIALCALACLLAVGGCGGDKPARQPNAEHFLSDQQKALEQAKAAAAAAQEAAAERAQQTEDARTN